MPAGAAVMDSVKGGRLPWLVSWCWLLSGGLSCSHVGFFSGLVECLHAVVAGFLQSKHSSRLREISQSLLDLIGEVTLAKQ